MISTRSNGLSSHHQLTEPDQPAEAWALRVVNDLADFDELEADWSHLLPSNAAPFLRFGWVRAWYAAFGIEPCALVIEHEGVTAAILPGYLHKRRFRLAGDACCDYQDLIVDPEDEEAIQVGLELAMHWLSEADLAAYYFFEKLSSEGVLSAALSGGDANIEDALVFEKAYAPCPRVQLNGGLEGYLAALPGKVRQDLRRSLRRLDKALPEVQHRIIRAPEAAELEAAAAFHVRHFRKNGTSPLAEPRRVAFLSAAAQDPAVGLQLSILEHESETLAIDIGFAPPGTATYYGYLTAFDPAYQKLAPGKCLMLRRIDQWASEDDVELLDFLAGDEAYKLGLTQGEGYEVRSIRLMPSGLVDRVRQVGLNLEKRGRRLARKGLEKSGFLNR